MRAELQLPVEAAASQRSRRGQQQRRALGGYVVLATGAWLALALIHYSPYAAHFGHEVLGKSGFSPPAAVGLFATGWLLMIVAMMLPAALPVLDSQFRSGAVGQRVGHSATWLAGNLSPWLLLGFAFAAADLVVHSEVAPHYPLLAARLPSLLWLAAGLHLVLVATAPSKWKAPPTRAPTDGNHAAFLRGWQEGLACLSGGWLVMLAVAGSHGHLGTMAAATVLMSAASFSQVPRWLNITAGVFVALLGARLLLAVP